MIKIALKISWLSFTTLLAAWAVQGFLEQSLSIWYVVIFVNSYLLAFFSLLRD